MLPRRPVGCCCCYESGCRESSGEWLCECVRASACMREHMCIEGVCVQVRVGTNMHGTNPVLHALAAELAKQLLLIWTYFSPQRIQTDRQTTTYTHVRDTKIIIIHTQIHCRQDTQADPQTKKHNRQHAQPHIHTWTAYAHTHTLRRNSANVEQG
jgi:hypothetical protein